MVEAASDDREKRFKILIVDDDATSRMILKAMLEREKFQIIMANNGLEAIERFKKESPDIILMDVLMPQMNGYDATRQIKESARPSFVPVIFLTGLTDDESLTKCVEAGGDDFMTKPYNPIILKSKINAMERIRSLYEIQRKQNYELNYHHNRLKREHDIIEKVYAGILDSSSLESANIKYFLAPMSTFSGDLLLSVVKPYGKQVVMLGDFTGHGLSASVGAVPVSDIFNSMAVKGFSISEIAAEINRKLNTILPTGLYLAACIVELDLQQGRVLYWNGGVPDGFLVDRNGNIKTTMESTNLPLGILNNESMKFEPMITKLDEGDRIFLYSDGVVEAVNSQKELFGVQRLMSYFGSDDNVNGIFDNIIQGLTDFRSSEAQSDDITMMELRCDPNLLTMAEKADKIKMPLNASIHWRMNMHMTPDMMRTVDLPSYITGLLTTTEVQGLNNHRTNIFMVLSELYNNALEHGILGLCSEMKSSPEGFLLFTLERKRLLHALEHGLIEIEAELTQTQKGGGKLVIYIEDNGPGFDFRSNALKMLDDTQFFGRGIPLVRSLCSDLVFYGSGNKVEAVYVWH